MLKSLFISYLVFHRLFFQFLLPDLVHRVFVRVLIAFLKILLSPNFVMCRIFAKMFNIRVEILHDSMSSFPTESSPSLTISAGLFVEACCGFVCGQSKESSRNKMNQHRKSQSRIRGTIMLTKASIEPVPMATTSCQRTSPCQSQVCLRFSGFLDKPALMAVNSNIVCILVQRKTVALF